MNTSELDYDLPPELIAQRPVERRDESRLLVWSRGGGEPRHRLFRDLPDELPPGTLVVVNDTRVVPARIRIERPRGEVLLLERLSGEEWEGLARPTRRLRAGRRYGEVELLEHLGEGRWRLRLHGERYACPESTWRRISEAERVLAVGTTTTRVLETLARGGPLEGRTELFVIPGFEFRRVDHLLTNFHLPRSTLLALVMAFAGVEETRRLYRAAVEEGYRFYSFGDAMLIR